LPFYLRRPVGLLTTAGAETTSNYISSEWQRIGSEPSFLDRTMSTAQAASFPLLVDATEFARLTRSPPTPFLVMARNSHVAELAKSAGSVNLLWTVWDYSMVRVSAESKRGAAQPALMGDKVLPSSKPRLRKRR